MGSGNSGYSGWLIYGLISLPMLVAVRYYYGSRAGHDMGTLGGWSDVGLWVAVISLIVCFQLCVRAAQLFPASASHAGRAEAAPSGRHRFLFHPRDPIFVVAFLPATYVHLALRDGINLLTPAGWSDPGYWLWAFAVTGGGWLILLLVRKFYGIAPKEPPAERER